MKNKRVLVDLTEQYTKWKESKNKENTAEIFRGYVRSWVALKIKENGVTAE